MEQLLVQLVALPRHPQFLDKATASLAGNVKLAIKVQIRMFAIIRLQQDCNAWSGFKGHRQPGHSRPWSVSIGTSGHAR